MVGVDLDIFFDRDHHDVLMGRREKRVQDKRIMGLIRNYLEAGIMLHGVVIESVAKARHKVALRYDGRFGTAGFIDFMERLVRYKRRKVFLIVDGPPVHKSKAARKWVEDHSDGM